MSGKKIANEILGNLPCVIFRFERDKEERCIYVSGGISAIFQFPPSELTSGVCVISDLVHEEDRAQFERTHASAVRIAKIAGEAKYESEYRIFDRDGRIHWVIEQGVVKKQGDILVRDGLLVDVTPHKEAAELVVEHQTRLATSSRLYSLAEMANGIAHEINNPLAVIKARSAQLIKMLSAPTIDTEQIVKAAQNIDVMTVRVSKIVKSLHMLARDSSSDEFQPFDLRVLVSDALELCHQKMIDKGITLTFSGLDEPVQIHCKQVQLAQVLLHMLNNSSDAIENLEEKFIRLDVVPGEDFVDIVITDSGSGIPEKVAEKIFQPFFTTKEVGRGTGLGLSVSRSFIKAHAGKLRIDRECKNTRFIITLPKNPSKVFKAA
jgi:C4-dicarboxylate-specific signal transduction histidine kinase